MILVNNPGSWAHIYAPLRHARWHGCTVADLVFPSFLFIVGVSIALSLGKAEPGPTVALKVLRRSATLFALGLLLAAFGTADLATIRIPGVLQRIAICYGIASLLFLYARPRAELWLAALILVAFWPLIALVGAPDLAVPAANVAADLDAWLLGPHMWKAGAAGYDPEGLLSTAPALATTLIGVATGRWLRAAAPTRERCLRLIAIGTAIVAVGWIWGLVFPINKSLWTSSYALFTAGIALVVLGTFTWAFDVRGHRRLAWPLVVFGVNALPVFVGSGLLARALGSETRAWLFTEVLAPTLGPTPASLAYALAWLVGWFAILAWMYRRGAIIKI